MHLPHVCVCLHLVCAPLCSEPGTLWQQSIQHRQGSHQGRDLQAVDQMRHLIEVLSFSLTAQHAYHPSSLSLRPHAALQHLSLMLPLQTALCAPLPSASPSSRDSLLRLLLRRRLWCAGDQAPLSVLSAGHAMWQCRQHGRRGRIGRSKRQGRSARQSYM